MQRTLHSRNLTLVVALGVSVALGNSCGGKSATPNNNPDTGGTPGDGDGDGDGDLNEGSGGASSGGASPSTGGDAGGQSTGGGAGGDDGLATFGGECDPPGTLACSITELKLTLLCDVSGIWVSNGTCTGDEMCDPYGANRGTCQPPLPYCDGQEAGHTYCEGQKTFECWERPVSSSEIGECTIGCVDGECLPVADECPEGNFPSCVSDCYGKVGCYQGGICEQYTIRSETWPPLQRIPAASELCPADEAGCEWGLPTGIQLNIPSELFVRIQLPGDWSALVVGWDERLDFEEHCAAAHLEGCVTFSKIQGGPMMWLFPKRADAAARNIEVEVSETPLACP